MSSKPGKFELAKGGTLFLDEIGDLRPDLQVKLLRVLEGRGFERVGGNRKIPLEARIVAATNVDLQEAMRQGKFRDDLYYRLFTVPIHLPPLREKREDIPILVKYFLEQLNRKFNKRIRGVDPKVMRLVLPPPLARQCAGNAACPGILLRLCQGSLHHRAAPASPGVRLGRPGTGRSG